MTELQRFERDILELQDRLTLRPTLDLATKIGERLIEAKKLVPHGNTKGESDRGWENWLARMGLRKRTAQVYMQIAKAQDSAHLPDRVSIEGFLRIIRGSRRRAWQEEIAQNRQAAIDADLPVDQHYKVVHADCRTYRWPSGIDIVVGDPPWRDLKAYRWLGTFTKSHLKNGGLLLAQCGTFDVPAVLDVLREAGLTYQWLLAIVYQASDAPVVSPPFMNYWRPILVFSNGSWDRKNLTVMSDTKTVKRNVCHKSDHLWQQPLDPWRYWLTGLTAPGQLIADPFCGAATWTFASQRPPKPRDLRSFSACRLVLGVR
jgi:hypothetical protein